MTAPWWDNKPDTPADRDRLLAEVGRQTREALTDPNHVTCPCGWTMTLWRMFKCFYCYLWLCPVCARRHFGEKP